MADKRVKCTMADLRASDAEIITARQVADVMGVHPQTLRLTARQRPQDIHFEFSFIGNRMRIPRRRFIEWMEGKSA